MERIDGGEKPQVVILGAGFGGLQASLALAKAPVRLTVIDRSNHHLFQPLLYQVATAALSPADITAPIRNILRDQKNAEVLMAEVTGIDLQQRRVLMGNRSVPYDYLIIATGAQDNYFDHEEWAENAPGLKSIPEATAIRSRVLLAFEAAEMEPDPEKQRALLTFVLVGAGPTGVEMSGAIAELARRTLHGDFRHIQPESARIILLEAGPRILLAFPESLASNAQRELERMGVEVRTRAPVEQIDESGVVVCGERIPCHNVIWSAGVKASPAGQWLGAEVDRAGRVRVEGDLTVRGHPEIFVIGDTAHVEQKGKQLPGVAQVAMQQGRYAASVIQQRIAGGAPPAPFYYWNKGNLATVGRAYAIVDMGLLRLSGLFAWVLWLGVHIFFLIGFRNRVQVLVEWAWAYFTWERGARLITSTRDTNTTQQSRNQKDY